MMPSKITLTQEARANFFPSKGNELISTYEELQKKETSLLESKNEMEEEERELFRESKNQENLKKVSKSKVPHKKHNEMSRRIEKEAKYAPVATLLMEILVDVGLYQLSKDISKNYNIKEQKSYDAIGLRFGLILNYLTEVQKMTRSEAINEIFRKLMERLHECVLFKYKKTNPQIFITMVMERSTKTIQAFCQALNCNYDDELSVFEKLESLYNKNSQGDVPERNLKFAKRTAKILIEASLNGKKFHLNIEKENRENSSLPLSEPILFVHELELNESENSRPKSLGESVDNFFEIEDLMDFKEIEEYNCQEREFVEMRDLGDEKKVFDLMEKEEGGECELWR